MNTDTKHMLVSVVGSAIGIVGMFVFLLVSEAWGRVICGFGVAVFTAPFVILWRDIRPTPRRARRTEDSGA